MTWEQHKDMLVQSVKWVLGSITLIIFTALMFFLILLASLSYTQHRVEVNMARQEVIQSFVE